MTPLTKDAIFSWARCGVTSRMYHFPKRLSAISSTAWFTWDAAECRMEVDGTIFFSQVGLACQAYATFHWQADCPSHPWRFVEQVLQSLNCSPFSSESGARKSVLIIWYDCILPWNVVIRTCRFFFLPRVLIVERSELWYVGLGELCLKIDLLWYVQCSFTFWLCICSL